MSFTQWFHLLGKSLLSSHSVCLCVGGCLLQMSGRSATLEDGENAISEVLKSRMALQKFQDMLVAQGVNEETSRSLCSENAEYFQYLQRAQYQTEIRAVDDGKTSISI